VIVIAATNSHRVARKIPLTPFIILGVFIAIGVILAATQQSAPPPQVSNQETAPATTTSPYPGNKAPLSTPELRSAVESGKPVVVLFVSENCPACAKEEPIFNRLADEYGDRVIFLKYQSPCDTDSCRQAFSDYEIVVVPTVVFIDAEGYVRFRYDRFINESTFREALEDILS